MIERFRLTSFLASALLVGAAALNAQQNRVTAGIDNSRAVVLHGHVRTEANARNDRGAVPGSFAMPNMMLLLKPSAAQQTALSQLLQRQQDASSPDYHRWLTPQQYAGQFGFSSGDISKISDWLTSQRFTVDYVAPSRTWIAFSGTAAQVAGAFGTSIHQYDAGGVLHYANSSDPTIPAALADVVTGIRGLSDFRLQPRLRKATPQMNGPGGTHDLAPDDLATIYDIAPLYAAGVEGTGQSLAVVGQSNINLSDIQAFNAMFNLPAPNVTKVLVGRTNPGLVTSGDEDESDLDLEWSGAVARQAQIYFYYSDDVWTSAMYAIEQNQAQVLTMSYGACEPSDLVDLPTFQASARQANAEGMTFVASSGDDGAADCESSGAAVAQNGLAVDAPASIPEVTGVGGTEFQDEGGTYWSATNNANSASALSYIPEIAWNDTALADALNATGGGASIFFPQPTWQTGVGVPTDGWRHVPDVALNASPAHDAYFVFTAGSAAYYGGTSFGAPVWAGVVALLNQYLVGTGIESQSGLGNINPQLYRLAGTGVFHDVTSGNNIVTCVAGSPNCTNGSLGYSATPGYDQTTGLGSLDAYNLVHQWSTKAPQNSAVAASIGSNPVFETSGQWTFTVTLSEEAGIATKLTVFTIDGTSYLSSVSSTSIPAHGTVTAAITLTNVAVPATVVFDFTGVDASGYTWTTQMSIPFTGPQINLTVGGASNSASGQQVYAPGMILSVYGAALGTMVQSAGAIPLPDYLAGFEAVVNGVPTPLYYVSPDQVNLQVPYETQLGTATLNLSNPYQSFTYQFNVSSAGPGIFMFLDGTVNPSRSGVRGQTYPLFITGEGQVTPALPTGTTPSPSTPLSHLPKPVQSVTVSVGGVTAQTTFIGIPSGLVGVTQINFTVPAAAPLGAQPVVVTVGTSASQPATFTVTE
jgi:uncharacterized protein (TIGR03437 family)